MVEKANISSLKLKQDGLNIEVNKAGSETIAVTQQPVHQDPSPMITHVPIEQTAPPITTSSDTDGLIAITSPMVGTFYAASNPDTPPFVKPGDAVNKGQVVCIVEAMKLFNEIESEVSGTIEKVCVENGQAVEFGQELFLIKP